MRPKRKCGLRARPLTNLPSDLPRPLGKAPDVSAVLAVPSILRAGSASLKRVRGPQMWTLATTIIRTANVFLFAGEGLVAADEGGQVGGPETSSDAFISIDEMDYCGGTELLRAEGIAHSLAADQFQVGSQLSSATFSATIPVADLVSTLDNGAEGGRACPDAVSWHSCRGPRPCAWSPRGAWHRCGAAEHVPRSQGLCLRGVQSQATALHARSANAVARLKQIRMLGDLRRAATRHVS
jgi:hypothetical protein